jgi:hypothetical protein
VSARVNHPLKSFILFLVVVGLGWLAYEFIYVRRIFEGEPDVFVSQQEKNLLRDMILDRYEGDLCFLEIGQLLYRPKENLYRVELRVGDGCSDRAKRICEEISVLVDEAVQKPAAVWALDAAGNSVAHYVP